MTTKFIDKMGTNRVISKDWELRNFMIGNKLQQRESKIVKLADFQTYNFCITKAKPSGYAVYHLESGLYIPTTSDYKTIEATLKEANRVLSGCKDAEISLQNALKYKVN